MNIQNKYTSLGKSILSSVLCAGVLTASMGAQANTQQEVSQVPLGLSEGVPPNMIFTLDESGSMSWGHVPDNQPWSGTWAYDSRRYRAANTNAIAYNPSVIYEVPPAFNSSGVEYLLSTSFTDAPVNGFLPDGLRGKVNLSSDYRVIREFRMPDGTFNQAPHPSDFSCDVSIPSNNSSRVCSVGGRSITVTRTGNTSCTVSPSSINISDGVGAQKAVSISCSKPNKNRDDITVTTTSGIPAYYYEFDESLASSCVGKKNDLTNGAGGESCYRLRWVDEKSAYDENGVRLRDANGGLIDGKKNFANWYSFYKTRALATLSATSLAFYGLSSDVRFTWQNLATCTSFTSTSSGGNCGKNSLKPYTSGHKGEFYTWLRSVYFNTGTPLPEAMKRAGEYLKTSTPWQKFPGEGNKNTTENTYACRPSYHVLMTDGMWNATVENPDNFRHDKDAFTTPVGETIGAMEYKQYKPFYDATAFASSGGRNPTFSGTLADIAMHYWATDLNSDLDNKVSSYIPYKNDDSEKEYWDPRNNPAEWQSMSNFIMGLGLTNSLNNTNVPWAGSTFAGEGYAKLKSGEASWPAASSGSDNNVYDLWHAAINSRGEFYSVDTPEAMVQAFIDILTRIADRKDSAAMPGVSTSLESDGAEEDAADRLASYFYQTTFDSGDGWAGDIQKVKKYRKYNEDTKEFEDVVEQGWSAKSRMPSADSRNIMIAGGGTSKLKAFSTTNAGDPDADAVGSLASYLKINPEPGTQVATWQQRLEYIRGSKANEGEGAGKLRQRSSILGDFLSSQPVIVSGGRYLEGFANRLEGNEAYTAFMQKVEGTSEPAVAGRRGQLYIGGNDGMLHAFDTKTGEEKFAFIPTAVFPKLNKLTGKNYSHEFYVDGTPVVADVYDGSKWRTILVGTLRAGGKGLFALDITNPDDIQLLWEFGENSIADEDAVKPGYSFPQPTVARMHNGEWAVVTGNGYKGEGTNNGAAALYIINAITGEMIKSLEVQSPIENGGENGLSSPRLADYDSDGIADYAYAGDLHGNLWRFDLLGTGASAPTVTPPSNGNYGAKSGGTDGFVVSNAGSPMFTATSTVGAKRQSITSAPNLVRHPTRKGYLVMFGTGKYFEIGDKTGEESFAQTLYGIWDMNTKAETATAEIITRGELAVQTITSETTGTGKESGKAREARIISNNPVQWYEDNDSSKEVVNRGWRLDLTAGGFTGEMIVENMRTLGSMLLLQTLVPNDDPCANGSTTWLYAINPATGGATLHHAFDTRTADQEIVSGIKFGSEGGVSISQNEKGFTANAPGDSEAIAPPAQSMGRQTWRMVPDA